MVLLLIITVVTSQHAYNTSNDDNSLVINPFTANPVKALHFAHTV